jgi:hypothetical protein
MIWGSLPYDQPIRHGMTQCRAFITTERDGYFREAKTIGFSKNVKPILKTTPPFGISCYGFFVAGFASIRGPTGHGPKLRRRARNS